MFFPCAIRFGVASTSKKTRLEVPVLHATTTTTQQKQSAVKRNLLGEYNSGTFAKPKSNAAKSPFKRVISTMAMTTAPARRRVSRFFFYFK